MSQLPSSMTVIGIRAPGGPEVLVAEQRPVPAPGDGEILVKVEAAGVNRPDVMQRNGGYPPPPGAPPTLGLEVAGEVVVAGGHWHVGDRVCALLGGGGYAEYVAVDARHVLPIPFEPEDDGHDFVKAAALPETVFTVWANVFEHGRLQPGETLLVHGATSGIGVVAVQMAKAAGAEVVATARGPEKVAQAIELGADIGVDSRTQDFGIVAKEAGGIDVALDMVGAPFLDQTVDALNTGGRIVYIAALGGPILQVPVWALMRKRAVITGSTMRPRDANEKARLAREVERVVWPWVREGKVKAVVDRVFPLADAGEAHAFFEQGRHLGKVVLVV